MKKLSTLFKIVGLLVFGLILYAGVERRDDVLMYLKKSFPRAMRAEPAKPAPVLAPLPEQIALCRKQRSGFQACMFDAGYAVNSAWTDAHKAAGPGPNPAMARDVVKDVYRAEASPTYGVPYWVPRPPK